MRRASAGTSRACSVQTKSASCCSMCSRRGSVRAGRHGHAGLALDPARQLADAGAGPGRQRGARHSCCPRPDSGIGSCASRDKSSAMPMSLSISSSLKGSSKLRLSTCCAMWFLVIHEPPRPISRSCPARARRRRTRREPRRRRNRRAPRRDHETHPHRLAPHRRAHRRVQPGRAARVPPRPHPAYATLGKAGFALVELADQVDLAKLEQRSHAALGCRSPAPSFSAVWVSPNWPPTKRRRFPAELSRLAQLLAAIHATLAYCYAAEKDWKQMDRELGEPYASGPLTS